MEAFWKCVISKEKRRQGMSILSWKLIGSYLFTEVNTKPTCLPYSQSSRNIISSDTMTQITRKIQQLTRPTENRKDELLIGLRKQQKDQRYSCESWPYYCQQDNIGSKSILRHATGTCQDQLDKKLCDGSLAVLTIHSQCFYLPTDIQLEVTDMQCECDLENEG